MSDAAKSPGAICRKAVRDRLAHQSTGWNSIIDQIALEYGAPELHLDFGAAGNVENALRDPEDIDAHATTSNLVVSIGVQAIEETKKNAWVTFSGTVEVVIQFLFRQRADDGYNFDALAETTESAADAIEACCLRVLNDPAATYPNITPEVGFSCERGPAEALQDGVRKPVLVKLQFEVSI